MSEAQQGAGLPEKEFDELLASIDAAAPLIKGLRGGDSPPNKQADENDPFARREALLCALKPYLSQERCEAIDYLLRMWRIGQTVKAIGGLYVHSTDV